MATRGPPLRGKARIGFQIRAFPFQIRSDLQDLVANPHAAQAPAETVPNPLAGPVAVRAVIDRGRRVVALTVRFVILRAVVGAVGGGRTDNGADSEAADDTGCDSASVARFGRLRGGHGRDGERRCDRESCHGLGDGGHGVCLPIVRVVNIEPDNWKAYAMTPITK